MKEHRLCLQHPETRGPTTPAASAGAAAVAAPGRSPKMSEIRAKEYDFVAV